MSPVPKIYMQLRVTAVQHSKLKALSDLSHRSMHAQLLWMIDEHAAKTLPLPKKADPKRTFNQAELNHLNNERSNEDRPAAVEFLRRDPDGYWVDWNASKPTAKASTHGTTALPASPTLTPEEEHAAWYQKQLKEMQAEDIDWPEGAEPLDD